MNKTLAGYTQNPERKKKSDLDKYITTPSTSFPGGIPGNEVGVLLLRTQKLWWTLTLSDGRYVFHY